MKKLDYVVTDEVIAYLLGQNNFINDESAILELVKNSYDAGSSQVIIEFKENSLVISDNGCGMNVSDIKNKWMYVGKSDKDYLIQDINDEVRIVAGSKGIGRFALARIGNKVTLFSKRKGFPVVSWETDWKASYVDEINNVSMSQGTTITIKELNDKWNQTKISNLISFLSMTYNDNKMKISVRFNGILTDIEEGSRKPRLGINCLSYIEFIYDSENKKLITKIYSDEFQENAKKYCNGINLRYKETVSDVQAELKTIFLDYFCNNEYDYETHLRELGNFSGFFAFNIYPTKNDCEKFLYKYRGVQEPIPNGVVLFRNAFSISTYEGKRDWLELGKRYRKSPAAATHPTGAWRVRENQISGHVLIDKKENPFLEDLSNRQGLNQNSFYELFISIILLCLSEFERYRQEIIRLINVKNSLELNEKELVYIKKALSTPTSIYDFTKNELTSFIAELKMVLKDSEEIKQDRIQIEEKYKYDVRLLNVLATVGLKASSIAHELKNDRSILENNVKFVIDSLKFYNLWDDILKCSESVNYRRNVPLLIEDIEKKNKKIVTFINTMLSEIEKRKFKSKEQDLNETLKHIASSWMRDYSWITISISISNNHLIFISEDILEVVLDNLILNSVQQNAERNHLEISLSVSVETDRIHFVYSDNGKGLDKKYLQNPMRIIEIHETTRKDGHGLGMWIVNNTIINSGGMITNIVGTPGFLIDFIIGGAIKSKSTW